MNSIAYMPVRPTKEALALAAAMKGVSNASVAHHMGVSDGLVSQWKTGRRPVPAHYAPKLARLLDVADPREISAPYAQVQLGEIGNLAVQPGDAPPDARSPELAIRRLENSLDSMRYALGALTSAMVLHRPAEARDVAKAIRRNVPPKFARMGFLAELLQVLDKAE